MDALDAENESAWEENHEESIFIKWIGWWLYWTPILGLGWGDNRGCQKKGLRPTLALFLSPKLSQGGRGVEVVGHFPPSYDFF